MSKKRILILTTAILSLLYVFILFFVVYQIQEKTYISSIKYPLSSNSDEGTKWFAYWSNEKNVEEDNFVQVLFDNKDETILTYEQENQKAETIYLHIKKTKNGKSDYTLKRFVNYINRPSAVLWEYSPHITNGQSDLSANISFNEIAKIKSLYVFLSDNALASNISKEKRTYQLIFSVEDKRYTNYQLALDLSKFNIGEGQYYAKILVVDVSGKETIAYSDKFSIDFKNINRLLRFETPMIGSDGQLIPRSPVSISGNALVLFPQEEGLPTNEWTMAENELYFSMTDFDINKIKIVSMANNAIEGIRALPGSASNSIRLEIKSIVPCGWYYLYYEDKFAGAFLRQVYRP